MRAFPLLIILASGCAPLAPYVADSTGGCIQRQRVGKQTTYWVGDEPIPAWHWQRLHEVLTTDPAAADEADEWLYQQRVGLGLVLGALGSFAAGAAVAFGEGATERHDSNVPLLSMVPFFALGLGLDIAGVTTAITSQQHLRNAIARFNEDCRY